jgi:phage replication-related protein YjqB (UPF0714/DUF867 family)
LDKYRSFAELAKQEKMGVDYYIEENQCQSSILIMAPHGGNIEFGTTEIARDVAKEDYGYYSFVGLREEKLRNLHLTSHNFDEPRALARVRSAQSVLTIHGFKGEQQVIYIGGLDKHFKYFVAKALHENGFTVRRSIKYKGSHVNNICNRGTRGMGVQLELSSALRNIFFQDVRTFKGRELRLPLYYVFIKSLHKGIKDFEKIHIK